MSERETSHRDIEYDFDDAPATEAPPDRGGSGSGRRRSARRRESEGGRVLRLAMMAGAAILVAVILILVVDSGSDEGAFNAYMERVDAVASDSEKIGNEFSTLVTTPGITVEELQAGLDGLAQQQAQTVFRAQQLDAPRALRRQQESLVEALIFRVSALNGLAQAFADVDEGADAAETGVLLAGQSSRLLTSDIIFDDLFRAGAAAVLEDKRITGIDIPDSDFLPNGETDLVSAESWALIVQRLTQSTAAGGLHGNQVASVRVLPGDQTLSPSEENTVVASDQLTFLVDVKNSGDHQETQVPVRLTLQLSPEPIQKERVVEIINPGDTKTVRFRDFNISGSFGALVTLKVAVEPVEGEANTANNIAEYSVIFTLG